MGKFIIANDYGENLGDREYGTRSEAEAILADWVSTNGNETNYEVLDCEEE